MEINFSQVGKNLAEPVLSKPLLADEKSSAVDTKQNSAQSKTQDLLKTAEKEESTERPLTADEISSAVEGLKDFAKTSNRQLNFSIDEGSAKQVVKVTDAESGEVIRQIPSEEILKLSERLQELQSDLGATVGILFNKQA